MKIAFVSEFVYPFHNGGAEKRFYEVAVRLAARGHTVYWYGMKDWPGPSSLVYEGVNLRAAGASFNVYRENGSRSIFAALRASGRLATAVHRSDPGVCLLDCSLYPFFHIPALRLLSRRTPLVVTWHEFWGPYWYDYLGPLGFFGKLTESATARMLQTIVAISDLVRAGLLASGVTPDRIETIYNGVDTNRIASLPAARTESDVVFFGRLKDHKNVDLLLRAVALLRHERPDLRVLILGDGPERERLMRLCGELELDRNVRFRGALDEEEMLGLVSASRLSVNPSTKEGGGSLTLLESNAAGVPVVAIRHPLGIDRRLIEVGRTGWWAEAAEPAALADAVRMALSDPRPRASVQNDCRSFVKEFDWDKIADQYERVYERALVVD